MKKLFFAAILTIGCFTMGQAQQFSWYMSNWSTTDTWDWKLAPNVGPSVSELNILPGQFRTGTLFTGSLFPIQWKAQDSNGCYITQMNFGPTPVIIAPTTCGAATSVTYQVGTITPFVHFYIKIGFP